MTKLRAPLKRWLEADLHEAQVQRMWRALNREPSRRLRWSMLGAGVAFALSAALWWLVAWSSVPQGPLQLADRSALQTAAAVGGEQPLTLALSDGSRVALAQHARLTVLANDGHAFAVRLLQGRTHFDVKPGGPRRWSIDCGAARVEVVGTSFSIERDERGVRVAVAHGIVAVRTARPHETVRRLVTGESLYVPAQASPLIAAGAGADDFAAPSRSAPPQQEEPSANAQDRAQPEHHDDVPASIPVDAARAADKPVADRSSARAQHAPGAITPNTRAARTRSDSAAHGLPSVSHEVAPAASQRDDMGDAGAPDAIRSSVASTGATHAPPRSAADAPTLASWLDAADVARRAHDPARAEMLLARVTAAAPGSAHAAVAALMLARMQLAREPAAAAAAVSSALAAALPESLREDAAALLVEAHVRAGQRALAQQAARAYLVRYPNGRRRQDVARWIGPP